MHQKYNNITDLRSPNPTRLSKIEGFGEKSGNRASLTDAFMGR